MDRTVLWCGALFAVLGGVFAAIGVGMLPLALRVSPVFLVFAVLGILFLALGIGLLTWRRAHRRRCAHLLADGQLIWADLVDVRLDTRFAFNGRHPFVLVCQAVDPRENELCLFASEGLWFDPTPRLRPGAKVPVYVEPENWSNYVVDAAAILPELKH